MESKKRVHLLISGLVQGVFFRASAWAKAHKFELTGWVTNLNNGQVEIIAEGEERNIKELISWVKRGSTSSKVEDVKVDWEEYTGEFKSFKIRH